MNDELTMKSAPKRAIDAEVLFGDVVARRPLWVGSPIFPDEAARVVEFRGAIRALHGDQGVAVRQPNRSDGAALARLGPELLEVKLPDGLAAGIVLRHAVDFCIRVLGHFRH